MLLKLALNSRLDNRINHQLKVDCSKMPMEALRKAVSKASMTTLMDTI